MNRQAARLEAGRSDRSAPDAWFASREAGGLGRIAPRSRARGPQRTAENREKIMKKTNN
ncbi:MAG: hypothetical protein LBB61_05070 [Treponema sp.]|nr:hypothetical protein [Treponema sp.]